MPTRLPSEVTRMLLLHVMSHVVCADAIRAPLHVAWVEIGLLGFCRSGSCSPCLGSSGEKTQGEGGSILPRRRRKAPRRISQPRRHRRSVQRPGCLRRQRHSSPVRSALLRLPPLRIEQRRAEPRKALGGREEMRGTRGRRETRGQGRLQLRRRRRCWGGRQGKRRRLRRRRALPAQVGLRLGIKAGAEGCRSQTQTFSDEWFIARCRAVGVRRRAAMRLRRPYP